MLRRRGDAMWFVHPFERSRTINEPPGIRAVVIMAVLTLFVTACTAGAPAGVARSAPDSFAPLVKRVLPAVVNIAVTETVSGGEVLGELPPELRDTPLGREFRRRFGNRREQTMGAGSGFIIDPSGLIVTNNHVVGHADKIVVSLTDGTRLPASVIGTDELTDVALIKVVAVRPAAIRARGATRGRSRWATGCSPPAIRSASAARSPPASSRRAAATWAPAVRQFPAARRADQSGQLRRADLQHGRPGDRDQHGHRVAIRRLGRHRLRHAERTGHPDRRRNCAAAAASSAAGSACRCEDSKDGVTVAGVERTSPAARAGLRQGDMILAVNGEHVETSRGLIRAVAARRPGKYVSLSIRRQGPRDGCIGHGRPASPEGAG